MIYFLTFLFTAGIFTWEAGRQRQKSRFEMEANRIYRQLDSLVRRLEKADTEEEIHMLIDLVLMNVNEIRDISDRRGFKESPACFFQPKGTGTDFNLLDIGELSILKDHYLNQLNSVYDSNILRVI